VKCPQCEFTFSDLRDICPKCCLDLRDFKRSSNIAVTYPNAAYEELYFKLKGSYPSRSEAPAHQPEVEAQATSSAPQSLSTFSAAGNTAALGEFFDGAFAELSSIKSDEIYEFQSEQFRNVQNRDDIQLLFDISFDTIKDPELEKAPLEKVITSDERKIQNESLQVQLARVERVVSAPQMSLKAQPLGKPAPGQAANFAAQAPASISKRALAFGLDFFILALVSLGIALLTILLDKSSILSKLSVVQNIEILDLIPPFVGAAVSMLMLLILYPFLSYLFLGRTYGEKVYGLELLRIDGRRPHFGNIAVRSMAAPLSLLFFGYLPLFRKKQPFHDVLSKTALFQL